MPTHAPTAAPQHGGGFMETLKHIPLWVWLGGAAALIGFYLYYNRQAAGTVSTPATTQIPTDGTTPTTDTTTGADTSAILAAIQANAASEQSAFSAITTAMQGQQQAEQQAITGLANAQQQQAAAQQAGLQSLAQSEQASLAALTTSEQQAAQAQQQALQGLSASLAASQAAQAQSLGQFEAQQQATNTQLAQSIAALGNSISQLVNQRFAPPGTQPNGSNNLGSTSANGASSGTIVQQPNIVPQSGPGAGSPPPATPPVANVTGGGPGGPGSNITPIGGGPVGYNLPPHPLTVNPPPYQTGNQPAGGAHNQPHPS